jgi:hypothetical protein
VFDDMLKKPCPYHKTPVNHTLEQHDLLKRYYSRVGVTVTPAASPLWRTSSSSSEG